MTPDPAAAAALDAFADAVHDLLHERALSIGAIDVAVEVNDDHLDGEVLFGAGPDIGFTLDTAARTCAYCELVPPDSERWLDDSAITLDPLEAPAGAPGADRRAELALALLQGLLDARRPLLRT